MSPLNNLKLRMRNKCPVFTIFLYLMWTETEERWKKKCGKAEEQKASQNC